MSHQNDCSTSDLDREINPHKYFRVFFPAYGVSYTRNNILQIACCYCSNQYSKNNSLKSDMLEKPKELKNNRFDILDIPPEEKTQKEKDIESKDSIRRVNNYFSKLKEEINNPIDRWKSVEPTKQIISEDNILKHIEEQIRLDFKNALEKIVEQQKIHNRFEILDIR